jgi:hypothetical protein
MRLLKEETMDLAKEIYVHLQIYTFQETEIEQLPSDERKSIFEELAQISYEVADVFAKVSASRE